MTDMSNHETMDPAESSYALDPRRIASILLAVDNGERDQLMEHLEPLHAADIADFLEQTTPADRARFIELLGNEFDGDILSELEEGLREEVIALLPLSVLAEAVRDLESDDVVDLVEDLSESDQATILGALEDSDRIAVQQSLSYPEYSAGRLMQREVVMAPEHWTVGQAIDFMRSAEDLPDQFYHMVLVDPRMHPVANVTLGRIMGSSREVKLADIAEEIFRTIPVTEDEGGR